jgi:hypothetical protein
MCYSIGAQVLGFVRFRTLKTTQKTKQRKQNEANFRNKIKKKNAI